MPPAALDSETAYAITVESGSTSVVLDQGQAAEFVFFVDSTGKWLVTQIFGGAVLS